MLVKDLIEVLNDLPATVKDTHHVWAGIGMEYAITGVKVSQDYETVSLTHTLAGMNASWTVKEKAK